MVFWSARGELDKPKPRRRIMAKNKWVTVKQDDESTWANDSPKSLYWLKRGGRNKAVFCEFARAGLEGWWILNTQGKETHVKVKHGDKYLLIDWPTM